MSIFLIKSLLSLGLLALTLVALFSMLEVFGSNPAAADLDKLKQRHRWSGLLFIAVFVVIGGLCLQYVAATKVELNPRSALHALLALTIAVLLVLKLLFVKKYRQFYHYAQPVGMAVAGCSVALIGITAGYFVLVTSFGGNERFYSEQQTVRGRQATASTGDVARGRQLFEEKCSACHDAASNKMIVGPGLKNVLKEPRLPWSGKPATPEAVRGQLLHPQDKMPAFRSLSEVETEDLIAYLKTL
ncbi:MAG TPA: cytochrome c [Dissulfurispiraceae bacterium]|nr:cytochrome c [Dissulfurispiraceae bacterium]